jgi:glycosyltransferase involved in cell wall biosynthesis
MSFILPARNEMNQQPILYKESQPPLVSVILPTFNVEAKVAASIRSALEDQSPFRDVEVLVLDGQSTDSTLAIVREMAEQDPRIKLWSEPDAGIYDAMNKGIARANGKMLYFMGAGDTLRASVFEKLAALPHLHPLLLLHGNVWHEGANITPGVGEALKAIDLARYNIPHQGAFYGRGVFDEVGGYNNDYRIYGDHELNWRCWTNSKIETRYWDYIVADFEGGGASSSLYDPNFKRDWPGHVWRRGGLLPWLSFQISVRFKPEQLRGLQKIRALLRRVEGTSDANKQGNSSL